MISGTNPVAAAAQHQFPISARPKSAPVRVCFLIDDLSRAGTETQLLALIRSFDRTRVQPSLVLLNGKGETSRALEPRGIPILRLGVKSFARPRTLFAAFSFMRFLRRERIDVLQAYFLDSIYFGVPLARLAGVRRVVRVRNNLGYWLTRKHRILGRIAGWLVDRTLTNSDQGREALIAEGVAPESITVLENGVDIERFSNSLPDVARDAVRIGTVANLRPIKDLDLLIRAAAKITKHRPYVRFEVVGEGKQRQELERLIADLNLGDRFRLLGAVDDVPAFLASLDVAVLCSRSEGMSNALLEYMAAGRAIVATRVGAAEKLIRDGVEGLLVPPGNAPALVASIEHLLDDRELARSLGEAARRRAGSEFSRHAMCRQFETWYSELAASRR